jgi:putative hydrolase of the HAD superfamily
VDIEAVFFDAGNTLIRPDPPVGHVYAEALGRAGVRADPEDVERRFQQTWLALRDEQPPGTLEYGADEQEAMDWWRRVVRRSLEPFAPPDAFGQSGSFEQVFRHLWDHFASPDAWGLYDDVLPALEALEARGMGLGLISNWDHRLERLLEGLGLAQRLRWTVVSCRVGVEKPAAGIFRHALGCCGLPPGRTVHVGDSYEQDVVGALQAGMRAVWLRREADAPSQGAGVSVVRRLTELPGLLFA